MIINLYANSDDSFNLSYHFFGKMEGLSPRAQMFVDLLHRPSLYKSEYDHICKLKLQNKKASIQSLYTQICRNSWRLWKFTHQQIKEMFDSYRDIQWETIPEPFEYFTSTEGQFNLQQLLGSPFSYLYNNIFPYFVSRANRPWTKEEDDLIIMSAEKSILNFSILALCIPGRTGKEISSRFNTLIKKGLIKNCDDVDQPKSISKYVRRYFLPNSEKNWQKI